MNVAASSPYWTVGGSHGKRYSTLSELQREIGRGELLLDRDDRLGISLWKDPGPEELDKAEWYRRGAHVATAAGGILTLAAVAMLPALDSVSGPWWTALAVAVPTAGVPGVLSLMAARDLAEQAEHFSQPMECQTGSIALQRADKQGLAPSVLYYRPAWSLEGYPFEKVVLATGSSAEHREPSSKAPV
ncbi:MAG: phage holin family protein [Armatimonadetes bacterium]|nr:phage holin family protein [Armatimonadota bacterium]